MGKIVGVTLKVLKSATDPLMTFLRAFTKKLQGGTQTALKSVKELVRGIKGWLDDKLAGWRKKLKNDKLVKEFSPDDLDWMHRRHKNGSLGGKVLTTQQLKALRRILQQDNIVLIGESFNVFKHKNQLKDILKAFNFKRPKQFWQYMRNNGYVGGFNAKTKSFILRSDATEIVVFHEMTHFKHWKAVGDEVYNSLSKLEKETHVWEQIWKYKDKWTKGELKKSLKYINKIRIKEYGLEPLKIVI